MTSPFAAHAHLSSPAAPAAPVTVRASPRVSKVLLVCGILSSLVYVAADVVGALRWESYGSVSQTISELSAIDAPSRSVWVPLGIAYDVLLIAFGVGVWGCAERRRSLRVVSARENKRVPSASRLIPNVHTHWRLQRERVPVFFSRATAEGATARQADLPCGQRPLVSRTRLSRTRPSYEA